MDSRYRIKVREATTEDAADIQRLARELAETVGDAPPVEEAVRKRLEELLEANSARVLVVEDEREVVGAVSFWIKPDLAHGDIVVEVPMLVIAEDHRRTGVGKLLMEEVRSVASDNGASQMELVTTPRTSLPASSIGPWASSRPTWWRWSSWDPTKTLPSRKNESQDQAKRSR